MKFILIRQARGMPFQESCIITLAAPLRNLFLFPLPHLWPSIFPVILAVAEHTNLHAAERSFGYLDAKFFVLTIKSNYKAFL